jgi:hypothetical protein
MLLVDDFSIAISGFLITSPCTALLPGVSPRRSEKGSFLPGWAACFTFSGDGPFYAKT